MDQSLYGDEHFTHKIVIENDPRDVWHNVFNTSITPPLHYGLAWVAVQFGGDDTILVRLPSLILGTALVPVVFLLGRRAGGLGAALLAAALIALDPFAIWFSDEGRAYATMMFLVALSTLALLYALDGRGRGWWAVFALATCGAMWTHYTAIFVLAVQAAWALWAHREHRKAIVLSLAAAAVGYIPWLRGFLEQRTNEEGVEIIDLYVDLTVGTVVEDPLRTLVGFPFGGLDRSPGTVGLLLVVPVVALVIAIAVRRRRDRPKLHVSLRPPAGLLVGLALATPIGLLLYDLGGPSLYLPRNLTASLPAFAVVVGVALNRLASAAPARVAVVAMASFLALLAINAVESVVDDDQRRPAYREAAQYLDGVAAASDPVIDAPLVRSEEWRFRRTTLDLYFTKRHPLHEPDDARAWSPLSAGRSVFVVEPTVTRSGEAIRRAVEETGAEALEVAVRGRRLGGLDGRAVRRSETHMRGIVALSISRYQGVVNGHLRRGAGRDTISWSLGPRVTVTPGVARGVLDRATPPGGDLWLGGWALAANGPELVDWVLFFSGGRLAAVSPGGGEARSGLARRYGREAEFGGFARRLGDRSIDRATVRAFAVVGHRASELPLSSAVKRLLRTNR